MQSQDSYSVVLFNMQRGRDGENLNQQGRLKRKCCSSYFVF